MPMLVSTATRSPRVSCPTTTRRSCCVTVARHSKTSAIRSTRASSKSSNSTSLHQWHVAIHYVINITCVAFGHSHAHVGVCACSVLFVFILFCLFIVLWVYPCSDLVSMSCRRHTLNEQWLHICCMFNWTVRWCGARRWSISLRRSARSTHWATRTSCKSSRNNRTILACRYNAQISYIVFI